MKSLNKNISRWLLTGFMGASVALMSGSASSQTANATADADALGVGVGIASANPVAGAMAGSVAYGGGGGGGGSANLNSNIKMVFEAPRRDIMPPTGLAPGIPIPQVFQAPTIPSAAKAIPLSLTYVNRCMPVASGEDLEEVHTRGLSRNTEVVFLPHPNYMSKGEVSEDGKRVGVGRVEINFPEATGNYNCLGIMSVVARKKRTDRVHMFGVMNDAQHFVKNKLSGFSNVELLCAQNAVGANIGFRSSGISGALSAGSSHLGQTSSTLGTLLGGITGLKSNTFPGVQIGMTCIVATTEGETEINISELNKSFGAMVAAPTPRYIVNGNGGGKAYGAAASKKQTTQ